MNIAVCMKQVPAASEGRMDDQTGMIIRSGLPAVINVCDLAALEIALQIKEQVGGSVTVFTMGPNSAEQVLREAFAIGADEGCLLSDKAFAGADVLATSYTLMQGITSFEKRLGAQSGGKFDLIICGKQTTDGDTGQVSGALAKWLNIPNFSGITKIINASSKDISLECTMEDKRITFSIEYPCVIAVERSSCIPRMPSLKLKMAAKKKEITHLTINDLEDNNPAHFGSIGSATRVKKIFPPKRTARQGVRSFFKQGGAQYIIGILEVLGCETKEETNG